MLESLPPPWRLALAYAPAATRDHWLTVLALDQRLADVVRHAREPVLAQLRLAWWRDRLAEPAENWPRGEPLLAALACWEGRHGALSGLVDGWEALLGEAPLAAPALMQLVDGRAAALAALPGGNEAARRMARGWALADLAAHVGHPDERAVLEAALAAHDWRSTRLARGMRPLVVLHGLARRRKTSGIALLALMRLGLFGV